MKKTIILISAVLLSLAACKQNVETKQESAPAESTAASGSIVYFNMDKVSQEYDMANDLRSVVETKVNGIQSEIDRRGKKLEKDINDFQSKLEKGLLTRSVAEVQQQKLQKQQADYQQYVMKKNQEMAEEQQVMMNQIANAISEYVTQYNEEKKFALILATAGDILSAPVVTGDPSLDVTEDIIKGLNEEYLKTKEKGDK